MKFIVVKHRLAMVYLYAYIDEKAYENKSFRHGERMDADGQHPARENIESGDKQMQKYID